MKQIRKNVFETNSSSTHSLTMCSEEDYEKWQGGKLIYDRWEGDLVEITDEIKQYRKDTYELNDSYLYGKYLTYEEYWETVGECYETFCSDYNGVVAFGYYGYDC